MYMNIKILTPTVSPTGGQAALDMIQGYLFPLTHQNHRWLYVSLSISSDTPELQVAIRVSLYLYPLTHQNYR